MPPFIGSTPASFCSKSSLQHKDRQTGLKQQNGAIHNIRTCNYYYVHGYLHKGGSWLWNLVLWMIIIVTICKGTRPGQCKGRPNKKRGKQEGTSTIYTQINNTLQLQAESCRLGLTAHQDDGQVLGWGEGWGCTSHAKTRVTFMLRVFFNISLVTSAGEKDRTPQRSRWTGTTREFWVEVKRETCTLDLTEQPSGHAVGGRLVLNER